MSLHDIGAIFRLINPHAGINPHGNCMHCAVIAANALVAGNTPVRATGAIAAIAGNGHAITQSYPSNHPFRAQAVYNWLNAAGNGVYAVDADDHAYNFIKTAAGLFLIDSNQHVFRKINHLYDFVATGHNDTVDDRYKYNYADPSDGCDVDIYHWGALHGRWAILLGQQGRNVGNTARGSFTWD